MNAIILAKSTNGAVKILKNNASNGPKIIPKIVPMIENNNPIMKPNIVRINVGSEGLSRIEILKSDNSSDKTSIVFLDSKLIELIFIPSIVCRIFSIKLLILSNLDSRISIL